VKEAEKYAWRQYNKIVLHARKAAVGFYRKLGYKIASGEFIEVTIPHFMMEKYGE
jgi:predicted GNAT family N-acyltransferase